jgi:hypothetical protein
MEKIIFNLSSSVRPRYEVLEGRQYLVVPMVMITEGVHDGSNGPLYYPEAELGKTPAVWNHKPIISYHPQDSQGNSISACTPEIIENRGVGLIMNTRWSTDDKKLRGEAWLDETKLAKVDSRVLEAIRNGKVVEISTGLFTDNEQSSGVWNGKKYESIARNYRPDHLAILFDQPGACKGAGLLVNEASVTDNREFSVRERKKLAKKGQAMKGGGFPIVTEKDLHNAIKAIGRASNPASAKRHIISRARALGKTDLLPEHWKLSSNAASYGHIQDQLMSCLSSKHGKPGERWNGYIEDVYPNQVIYGNEGELYSHAYSVNGNDYVVLTGDPKKMKRMTTYVPSDYQNIGNDYLGGIGDGYGTTGIIPEGMQVINQGNNMPQNQPVTNGHMIPGVTHHADGRPKTREERVHHMIQKGHYKEEHRPTLHAMPEEHFSALEAIVHGTGAGSTTSGSHADTQPTNPAIAHIQATGGGQPLPGHTTPEVPGFNSQQMTVEQYIGNAPAQIRDLLVNALAAQKAEKDRLIAIITANSQNQFSKTWLEQQQQDVLIGLAALAQSGLVQNQSQQQGTSILMTNGLRPNFLGASGAQPVQNVQDGNNGGEGLKLPEMTWN